jgi:hypothetical protein
MTVPGVAQPINKFLRMILRSLLYLLPLLLISQPVGQPALDDQFPVKGARVLSAKIVKQQNQTRGGFGHLVQPALAVGSGVFTACFYLFSLILSRPYEVIRSPLAGQHSSRAPPSAVV